MIWVIAGTIDGRQLALEIANRYQQKVFVSVVSSYGAQLASNENIEVYTGRLDAEAMSKLIVEKNISMLVDASHPYAAVVTKTAIIAAKEQNIPYVRFERKEIPLPEYPKLYHTVNEVEAAELAAELAVNNKVYLTTGSKTLSIFKKSKSLADKEVWARVLPTTEVIKECEELGILPKYIVALQGPFSYELNKAMFKDTAASVIVMKNSGLVGGSDTKLQAAIDLGINIVLIDRPRMTENVKIIHDIEEFFYSVGGENGLHKKS